MLRVGSSDLDMEGGEGIAQWPEYRAESKEAAPQHGETCDYQKPIRMGAVKGGAGRSPLGS